MKPAKPANGSQRRSKQKRLAIYDSVEEAMQGAEAFEATGRFAPKPRSHHPQPPTGQQGLF